MSIDEEHIYTRNPKRNPSFTADNTLQDEIFSTSTKPKSTPTSESTSTIDEQTTSKPSTHCSQVIPFHYTYFFKYKNCFQTIFLPNDYSLDLKPIQQQQSQDPVLRSGYSWLSQNERPEYFTPLITITLFYTHITKKSHNISSMIPLTILDYTQRINSTLKYILIPLQT